MNGLQVINMVSLLLSYHFLKNFSKIVKEYYRKDVRKLFFVNADTLLNSFKNHLDDSFGDKEYSCLF